MTTDKDTEALIERLRWSYENWALGSKGPSILLDAAPAIRSQQDRIRELEAERDEAKAELARHERRRRECISVGLPEDAQWLLEAKDRWHDRALHAEARVKELEADRDEFRSKLAEASGKQKVLADKLAEVAERELALANGAWEGAEEHVAILRDKLAEAIDAIGSPDEWAEKRKELEGWTGSAWLAGEGDEDLRSECYSFLCGLFGWLHAAETASRALMQKMEGTDANNG